ncbi:MAG: DUF2115 domain-containing protein [Euryarchaeota archaeon]|nr:DUF2115 domain-containing protein [Euryarchaeota archaeon]MBV1729575.1 DUF2115 domain-containing protein [Methanobacterium sp.]MBU4548013.1 DUF2115 domain-containing protein [Euryarchaeota archaeon]MBU4608360.1 DUF2115 domain-containing protein [Euryarchaeota archaeon]MBV1754122.1 DUF2115 domain-containing protein [Methanobacterium sp.]
MKACTLLSQIKTDIKKYHDLLPPPENKPHDNSLESILSHYNQENFRKIMDLKCEGLEENINEEALADFKNRIDYFFSIYAPDDLEFREFIKLISIYLSFIAKKPLHPPGTVFDNGKKVYQKGPHFICTGKNIFQKDEESLCKYCVAKNEE